MSYVSQAGFNLLCSQGRPNFLYSQGLPGTPEPLIFPSQMPGLHMPPHPIQKDRTGSLKVSPSFRKIAWIGADRLSLTCLLLLRETEGEVLNPICFHRHLHQLPKGAWMWRSAKSFLSQALFELHSCALWELCVPHGLADLCESLCKVSLGEGHLHSSRGQSLVHTPPTKSPEWNQEEEKKTKPLMISLLAGISKF